MKSKILLLFFAFFAVIQGFAQSQQELIEQAKAMGVSEDQIQKAMLQGASNHQNKSNKTETLQPQDLLNKTINPLEGTRNLQFEQDSLLMLTIQEQQDRNMKLDSIKNTVFGREIFTTKNLSFQPNLNIPTPKDYVLSAGDEVKIDIWGNSELSVTQKLTPEGRVFIPEFGPISLSGLTVDQAEDRVRAQMTQAYSGLDDGSSTLSLTLSQVRSIKVNVVGEALIPGTYILPSFSTVFNALYMAGGVNDVGSLRVIKVFRKNELKTELDVYDYLIYGKSDSNIRLEDGDMVMIAPYESLVYTVGGLKRERIFEMKKGETVQNLLTISGGFKGVAYKENVQIKRKNNSHQSIQTIESDDYDKFQLHDGDTLTVKDIALRYKNRLAVKGAVWYPGEYELNDKVNSVKSLVEIAEGLKGDEFAGRAQIVRINPDFSKSIVAVDIRGIVNGTSPDVKLQNDDELVIPLISELREKYTISVSGAVNNSCDTLDYNYNMTVEDAIILAGGLKESAATIKVDVARRVKNPSSSELDLQNIVKVIEVTLNDGLAVDTEGKVLTLEPFDQVYVRYSPGYREQERVSIKGEVLFKGDYVLKNVNSRLSDVISDAGGVTSESYVRGASLIRKLTDDEMQRIETLLELSKKDEGKDSVSVENIEIDNYTVGIDLEKALANPGSADDIVLRDGDILSIPKRQSTVKVSGAVIYPNSATFIDGMKTQEYIAQAGGYSEIAKRRPIVIYMNGKVAITKSKLFGKKYPNIEPGCEVLVTTKRLREKMTLAEVMSLASSTTSMAAMIASLLNTLK